MIKMIMTRAWEIARAAVQVHGGKASEYIADALRMAWAETRESVKAEIEISTGSRKHKSWIAKIVGKHERFGLDRVFAEPVTEGMMYKTYVLDAGIYEVCKGGDRHFIRVVGGNIETIAKAEVLEMVA